MRNIRIEAAACLWWAFLLLVLPLRWLVAALCAGGFHEFCHYLAVRAVGGGVEGLVLRPAGAVMRTTPLSPRQELLCALAGPVGGLALLLFARWIPLTALCALVQSAFNLLPVFPLDGGRALECAVRIFLPRKKPDRICGWAGGICVFLAMVLCCLAAWRFSLGLGALLPPVILARRLIQGKRPCKTAGLALQ